MSHWKNLNWPGWLMFGLLLMIWELSARGSPKLQLYFPPMSQIIAGLAQSLASGTMVQHLTVTVGRFLAGYWLSAAIAVTVGVILGYFRFLHSLFEMLIEFLRPMPSVAIIPVAILLLGIGD
jgi:NitT/TauT family transport system permease protein